MPPVESRRREKRPANQLTDEGNGTFGVTFHGRARRAYLWVILILSPLPIAAVASLIFGVLDDLAWIFAALFALQIALALFAVVTMTPTITYLFDPATGFVTYRRAVYRRERKRTFANVRNFRQLFVSSQVVGRARRYLIYQMRAIHADGRLVNLSGYETGHPDALNALGQTVAERLGLPFTPAARGKVSRVVKKLGPKVRWRVESAQPA